MISRQWAALVLGLSSVISSPGTGRGDESGWDGLERQFRELPMEARRLTGPLYWLHGDESRERLESYVGKVAEGGNGTFTAESRPHRDWLGKDWYRDLQICLDAARRHNLTMWIFDEKWWPSQEVGGAVPPRYGSKRLAAVERAAEGPGSLRIASAATVPNFLAVVAGKTSDGGIDPSTLVDLTERARAGEFDWAVPAGSWRVMTFSWERSPGPRILVDGASKDCVDWFLKTVYQPHYDRFGPEFGKTIVGFFYDEPETHGDWGTELPVVLAEKGVDWKQAYVAWKFTLAGDAQAAARYAYHEALSEAWGRTLYGGMTRWCRDHRVSSIGHFLEHNHEYLDQHECAGNMMQLQKYSDMGAIDAVFKQFVPGRKDGSTYQTPKLGSSITHAYGKAEDLTMVEIFGARGQDLSYPEMKWWTDLMHVAGVNFLIPHSFNPRAPYDTDCPPYFYNGGYEPRWPLYKVFADYTSRLSLLLSGGRHVAPVAILFLGHSRQVGRSVTPEAMTTALQDALYDCDWLPYEVVENDAKVVGKELQLRQERYRVLVVPPVEVIPPAALAMARAFFESGGVVIGHGFLPSKSATPGKTGADVQSLREAIWGKPAGPGLAACNRSAAGGRAYFLPESPTPEQLHAVLADDAGIAPDLDVLEGRTNHWLHVLHRVKSGRDVFFITNQNVDGKAERFRFKVRAEGVPECWDAMRDEITAVPFRRTGEHVELTLALEPLESVLLVFRPSARPLPPRPETTNDPPGARNIPVIRDLSAPVAQEEPPPAKVPDFARSLDGCSWVWYPEGEPATAAPPGSRYFRKFIELPPGRTITRAVFAISADNEFILHVNGAKLGQSGGGAGDWSRPAEVDVTTALRAGSNVLAIRATNTSRQPNPAGLIGRLRVEFDRGDPLAIAIDPTWKAGRAEQTGWAEARFDDGGWASAREVAPLGGGPWGRMSGVGPTLSPVRADPFVGRAELPSDVDLDRARVLLQLDELAPEAAARVTVNGHDSGGFIGRPLRLDVTRRLRAGANTIRIEPFAPRTARLVIVAP